MPSTLLSRTSQLSRHAALYPFGVSPRTVTTAVSHPGFRVLLSGTITGAGLRPSAPAYCPTDTSSGNKADLFLFSTRKFFSSKAGDKFSKNETSYSPEHQHHTSVRFSSYTGCEPTVKRPKQRIPDTVLQTDFVRNNDITPWSGAVDRAREVLREVWGYSDFRNLQEKVIERLLWGGSASVIMPTAGGKSLIYQIPAVIMADWCQDGKAVQGTWKGITVVVSPLLSLIRDQVTRLQQLGVPVESFDSSKTAAEMNRNFDLLRHGTFKIIYITPEQLHNSQLIFALVDLEVKLFAVDEAHCMAEWGHAFRPQYLRLPKIAEELRAERVLCLTATATKEIETLICEAFDIPAEGRFRMPNYRPNLSLHAKVTGGRVEKKKLLLTFLRENPGPAIVYCTGRKECEYLAAFLRKHDFNAKHYHGGLGQDKREEVQQLFTEGNKMIIVATTAFGMGVDKSNIRSIVNFCAPQSVEAFTQMVGRAGRDSLNANCLTILDQNDMRNIQALRHGSTPSFTSIITVLSIFFSKYAKAAQPGDKVKENFAKLASANFITEAALDIILHLLEHEFKLIREQWLAKSKYSFRPIPPFGSDSIPNGPLEEALISSIPLSNGVTTINADVLAEELNIPKSDVVGALHAWEAERLITMYPDQRPKYYEVLQTLPSAKEVYQIAQKITDYFDKRERVSRERFERVISLFNNFECIPVRLLEYFGDKAKEAKCGKCSFCLSGRPALFFPHFKDVDEHVVSSAYASMPANLAEPRLLADLAWGMRGERFKGIYSVNNISTHIHGICAGTDYAELYKAFKDVCTSDGDKMKKHAHEYYTQNLNWNSWDESSDSDDVLDF